MESPEFRLVSGHEFSDWCRAHHQNPATWKSRDVPGRDGYSISGNGIPIGDDDLEIAIVLYGPSAVAGYGVLRVRVPHSVNVGVEDAIGRSLSLFAQGDLPGSLAANQEADQHLRAVLPQVMKANFLVPTQSTVRPGLASTAEQPVSEPVKAPQPTQQPDSDLPELTPILVQCRGIKEFELPIIRRFQVNPTSSSEGQILNKWKDNISLGRKQRATVKSLAQGLGVSASVFHSTLTALRKYLGVSAVPTRRHRTGLWATTK